MKPTVTAIGDIVITDYGNGHFELYNTATQRHAQVQGNGIVYFTRADLSERTGYYDSKSEAQRIALYFVTKKP